MQVGTRKLFQDFELDGDLEDRKSTSGRILCIFGSHTFVPICWMCKKRTSVSHCSTESEIISLDAGLRMDGLPALGLWDIVIELLYIQPTGKRKHSKESAHHFSSRPDCSNTAEVPSLILRTVLSAIPFVSER